MSNKPNPKKVKLVRDSFSLPKAEYASIDALKKRAMTMGVSVKKSELLRAGLMWLSGASDSALKAALTAVPTLKTGRPAAEAPKKPAAKAPVKSPAKATAPRKAPAAKKAAAPVKAAAKAPAKAPVSRARRPAATPQAKPAA
jgi:nucleoid-associated protein YgaU